LEHFSVIVDKPLIRNLPKCTGLCKLTLGGAAVSAIIESEILQDFQVSLQSLESLHDLSIVCQGRSPHRCLHKQCGLLTGFVLFVHHLAQ
jgi:hypothetical protein